MRGQSTQSPINPSGLCQCGCGAPAPIAKRTNACYGHVAGQPIRFIRGHQCRGANYNNTPPNPSGLCQCGCGQVTARAKTSDHKDGIVRGEYVRYVFGHHTRLSPLEYIEEDRGYETPCWIWQRAINKRTGYGVATPNEGGTRTGAHIVFWERVHGSVPFGADLDHKCRVRACVNPDHLEPVSRAVNLQRGAKAKITPDIVCAIRKMAETTTMAETARVFGLSFGLVKNVVHRHTWRNIE